MLKNKLTLAAIVFGVATSVVAADFDPIALTGQQAAGAPPGVNYRQFTAPSFPPVIGASVYFTGGITGSQAFSDGLWRGDRDSTVAFWIEGDDAPGTNDGITFRNVLGGSATRRPIAPNDIGQSAFIGRVQGTDITIDNDTGIWAGAPGALGLVARRGSIAPGTTSTFTGLFGRLVYNNTGQVAFQDRFEGNNRRGIWSGTPGSIEAVALSGDPAPGFGPGATFGNLSLENQPLALNNSGQLAFFSQIFGATGNPNTIWTGNPGAISAAVVEDQVAPGTGGKLFSSFGAAIDINDNGEIGFRAGLTGLIDSIWFGAPDNLSPVVQEGEQAPGKGQGVIFRSFIGNPVINDQGGVAFLANLTREGIGGTDRSLWVRTTDGLELIAQQGDQVPGFAEGTVFSFFEDIVLNNCGQIAFEGIFGGVESGRAIFATDGTNAFNLVVRSGDVVDVEGELLPIALLSGGSFIGDAGSSDGRPNGFNDEGDLTFLASFAVSGPSRQGIFVTNVPTETVAVPNVVGSSREDGEVLIVAAGLVVGSVTDQPSDTVTEGNVISQNPPTGTELSSCRSSVELVISTGPGPLPIRCDVDEDGVIDRGDIRAILQARRQPADGPDDPRDADGNGEITAHDAKLCIKQLG